jgi:hypothetical protein
MWQMTLRVFCAQAYRPCMTNVSEQSPPAATATAQPPATSRVVAYPSQMLRPIPSFVFAVPQGWVLDEAPDAIGVVRTPQEVDGFWVNAILSHDRVPRSVDFKQAAQVTFAKLKQGTPDAKVTMERLARFGSNVVYLRGVELSAPKTGRALAQLHALFFAPVDKDDKGKTVDFFQIIATAPADQMSRFGNAFVEMISSFRFV